jgi:prevent-host-death family protein
MKTITISELRAEPGEFLRAVQRGGQSFLITKNGVPVAKLGPVDDTTVIESDGRIRGELPLTISDKKRAKEEHDRQRYSGCMP